MGKPERRAYLEAIRTRYRRARKGNKTVILNEFCAVCGYHRKYALRLLSAPFRRTKKPVSKSGPVAMCYNWWSLFVRLANPKACMEAITSRPLLLSGVGRKTTHAGQQHLAIAPMHGKASQAISLLTKVSLLLKEWKSIAEQSPLKTVWFQVCEHIAKLVTGINWLEPLEIRMRLGINSG